MQEIGTNDKDGKRVQGTDVIFFINKDNIPTDQINICARFLCKYRLEKRDEYNKIHLGRKPDHRESR